MRHVFPILPLETCWNDSLKSTSAFVPLSLNSPRLNFSEHRLIFFIDGFRRITAWCVFLRRAVDHCCIFTMRVFLFALVARRNLCFSFSDLLAFLIEDWHSDIPEMSVPTILPSFAPFVFITTHNTLPLIPAQRRQASPPKVVHFLPDIRVDYCIGSPIGSYYLSSRIYKRSTKNPVIGTSIPFAQPLLAHTHPLLGR